MLETSSTLCQSYLLCLGKLHSTHGAVLGVFPMILSYLKFSSLHCKWTIHIQQEHSTSSLLGTLPLPHSAKRQPLSLPSVLHQCIALVSHSAKPSLLSMTTSYLQNKHHLGASYTTKFNCQHEGQPPLTLDVCFLCAIHEETLL